MEQTVVFCSSSLLFSNCTKCFLYAALLLHFFFFSVILKNWYQILIRHLKSGKTHETVKAEKQASSPHPVL